MTFKEQQLPLTHFILIYKKKSLNNLWQNFLQFF